MFIFELYRFINVNQRTHNRTSFIRQSYTYVHIKLSVNRLQIYHRQKFNCIHHTSIEIEIRTTFKFLLKYNPLLWWTLGAANSYCERNVEPVSIQSFFSYICLCTHESVKHELLQLVSNKLLTQTKLLCNYCSGMFCVLWWRQLYHMNTLQFLH